MGAEHTRIIHGEAASMKGFPRRGSDLGEKQRGVGLPHASMKGFPRRGSDARSSGACTCTCPASMKGFPRRGSDRRCRHRQERLVSPQ